MGTATTGYLIRDLAEIAMGVETAEEFRYHAPVGRLKSHL